MTDALKNAPLATLLLMLLLGGCASSNVQKASLEPMDSPLRMVVEETPNSVEPAALRNVLAPDLPEGSDEANKLVESGMAQAETGAMAEMQTALTNAGMKVVSTETPARSVNESGGQQFATKLSIDQAKQLQLDSGADDLLRFRITDYGLTPRDWRNWVIGFEVVTTVGIAAIAYSVPETRPLAGVYLVTETVEEGAEAYAGFWALDKLTRPVRTEAELFDLHTGERVWADSNTGLAKVRLARLFASIDAPTRNAQLKDATHESIKKLVGRLAHSLAGTDKLSGSGGRK
jgi:hypothetical protein